MAGVHRLTDGQGTPFRVFVHRPEEGKRRKVRVLIMPGANCAAERYRWLAGPLAEAGATVLVPDPPLVEHPSPFDPSVSVKAAYVTVDQMVRTLALPWSGEENGQAQHEPTFAFGHSLGGTVILEYFDPEQAVANPRSGVGEGYRPPLPLNGAVIVGATLQADVMGMTLPWRDNDTPLAKPEGFPVLFVAGENDKLAPPHKVSATVARYAPPTALVVQEGANHFGWTEGEGALDRHDLDGVASLAPEVQKAATLRLTEAFLFAVHGQGAGDLADILTGSSAAGDTVEVREAH